jgi:hypothetical protein
LLAGVCSIASLLPGGAAPALTAPTNLVPPSLSGTATQGETLTLTPGSWSGNPIPSVTRDWQRDGLSTGQTGLTYTLTAGDVGGTITVVETATNSQGTATATSNAIGPIASAPPPDVAPSFSVQPSISGTPTEGQMLMGDDGTYSGSPAPTVSARRWKRDGVVVGMDTMYTLVTADVGAMMTFEVDITNSAGSATGVSAAVGPVAAAPSGALTTAPVPAFEGTSNPPGVSYTLPADGSMVVGDWIGREYDDNAGFTSPTLEWHQITGTDAEADSISWPFAGAFPMGSTLYLRAYGARGSAPGSFTDQVGPSAVISRTFEDTVPDAWDFTDQTDVATSTLITSNAVTPVGYTAATPVVTNGNAVSINGGAFSTADTTLSPGQSIAVQVMSASTSGTAATATINVGGVDITFTVTTTAAASGADFVASATQIGHQTSAYGGTVDFAAGRQLVAIMMDNSLGAITGVTIGGQAATKIGGSTNNRWVLYELANGTAGSHAVAISGAGNDLITITGTVTGATGAGTGLTVKDFGFSVSPAATPAGLVVPAGSVGVAFAAMNLNTGSFTGWNNGFTEKGFADDGSYRGTAASVSADGTPSVSFTGTEGTAMFGIVYPG